MKHVVIGTAGHVDHGKTMLVKALANQDTDRLKEEKKRGITIELGFAHMVLSDGSKVGIIDVPGHEKFIKNMLTGIGGIDFVLMVIAADEGFMTQSKEHLDILEILGIKKGLIVISKVDMVEDEWLEMVKLDILDKVKGTFLENAGIFPVSSLTGMGIKKLRDEIEKTVDQMGNKRRSIPFKLPVDRVFSAEGFGTVVTGTLVQGQIKEGDSLTIYPKNIETKVRKIQAYEEDVSSAFASQRVALNISGIKVTDIGRGAIAAAENSMESSYMLDVRIHVLPDSDWSIKNGSRLHLHIGSEDMVARCLLVDKDVLEAGQKGYAQLRVPEPISTQSGDRFVLRFFSPLETIAGGIILDSKPSKYSSSNPLKNIDRDYGEENEGIDLLEAFVKRRSPLFPQTRDIKRKLFKEAPDFDEKLQKLISEQKIANIGNDIILHEEYVEKVALKIEKILNQYHKDNPLKPGMPRDELWGKIFMKQDSLTLENLLDHLLSQRRLQGNNLLVASRDFVLKINDKQKKMMEEIEKKYISFDVNVPDVEEIARAYAKNTKEFKEVFEALVDSRRLMFLSPKIAVHVQVFEKALAIFDELEKTKGIVDLGDFRDALNTSRKYAIALLEYFDRKKLTEKIGEGRKRIAK